MRTERKPADGVMLMAYGAPASLEEVPEFYTHIRGGRRPPPDRIEELRGRYAAMGDCASLLRITDRLAARLQERLDAEEGPAVLVFTGMRHSRPFIHERMAGVEAAGIRRLVGLPLAPHFSTLSVGAYHKAIVEAAAALANPPELILVHHYHDHPGLVAAFSGILAATAARIRDETAAPVRVVFTAHSLPERILAAGEPYRDQLLETARLVAEMAGESDWEFAFQSASPTGEPWMGPDFLDVIRRLGREGPRAALIAPVGFLADHLEILHDVDILARRVAAEAGVALWRTPSLNDSAGFVGTLAQITRDHLGESRDRSAGR